MVRAWSTFSSTVCFFFFFFFFFFFNSIQFNTIHILLKIFLYIYQAGELSHCTSRPVVPWFLWCVSRSHEDVELYGMGRSSLPFHGWNSLRFRRRFLVLLALVPLPAPRCTFDDFLIRTWDCVKLSLVFIELSYATGHTVWANATPPDFTRTLVERLARWRCYYIYNYCSNVMAMKHIHISTLLVTYAIIMIIMIWSDTISGLRTALFQGILALRVPFRRVRILS